MPLDTFPPDDDDDDSPILAAERSSNASRSTWVSVAVNVVLSNTLIVVGTMSKSQGLIADGKHCLSDLVSVFVVLLANHASQKDADEDHPYGHHRFETAASLALGAILLTVGVGMLWSAAVKLKGTSKSSFLEVPLRTRRRLSRCMWWRCMCRSARW